MSQCNGVLGNRCVLSLECTVAQYKIMQLSIAEKQDPV